MRSTFWTTVVVLLLPYLAVSQSAEPLPVLAASWERTVHKAASTDTTSQSPARALLPDDKYFQRKTREQRTDNPMDPNRESMDARSAAIDKAIQESRTPKTEDVSGYNYTAAIKNDTGRTVSIIFWEYRFTEIAHPTNVVRRQFLCGVDLKDGATKELSAFSLLGPSDVIDAASLAKANEKLFEEMVLINRIEFADGAILQRTDWKFADVKKAVERITSTPWNKEICRVL